MKTAVVLLNLGGPQNLKAVRGFLFRLFADKAIINLPAFARLPLAALIAGLREKKAKKIYEAIGGGSPLLARTEEQARALEKELGPDFRCFIAMRYTPPGAREAARAIRAWGAEKTVLLPMYPQFSSTTTASSFRDFEKNFGPCSTVHSYPDLPGFIEALAALIRPAYEKRAAEAAQKNFSAPRLLLSAHGLPQKIADAGDPYPKQCEISAEALVRALNIPALDWKLTYQSRLGPLPWLKPYTDEEIRSAGTEQRPLIIAPLSFTADNSETVYEIDQLYRDLALDAGVPLFESVACVNTHPQFIAGLAGLIRKKLSTPPKG
ncbi:MAG TPA: ferrochelatase [Alphaproteobacteria bacterium]|nr:ferrochelatase [Alphaproteobacteria bacterium]